MAKGLGRHVPSDWRHVERFPLTVATMPTQPTPVVIGVNWYSAFDRPLRDKSGHWWIGRDANLGSVRGGHCVTLRPAGLRDPTSWWQFYDQGYEGACVGFGVSRVLSLMNRRRYLARWTWDRAKEIDEWVETNPGDDNGTSVRAGLEVSRVQGAVRWNGTLTAADADWRLRGMIDGDLDEGIGTYRWALSMDDVLRVLDSPTLGYVTVLNSWGRSYPHLVRMPVTTLDRLWREDGEIGLVTDK